MNSDSHPVRLYATHAWTEDDDYQRLFEFLESARGFTYRNLSRPEACPRTGREAEQSALRSQIDPAEIVLVLAGQYAASPFLIDYQANCARGLRKPVLLLSIFGGAAPPAPSLAAAANEVVDWNERALVDAIRRLTRRATRPRYATIDFTPD